MEKTEETEKRQVLREMAKHNAKINRIEHFRSQEDRAQALKQLKSQVNDQTYHEVKSQVLL